MKSWKTSLGGILLGVGVPLSTVGEGIYKTIGVVMSSVGGILMGIAARDNAVTSENAGAK